MIGETHTFVIEINTISAGEVVTVKDYGTIPVEEKDKPKNFSGVGRWRMKEFVYPTLDEAIDMAVREIKKVEKDNTLSRPIL